MATTGQLQGTFAATSGGAVAWTNPNNSLLNDANDATAVLATAQLSGFLIVSGFDFSSVPAGAVINSIIVRVNRRASALSSVVTPSVLLRAGRTEASTQLLATDTSGGFGGWPTTNTTATHSSFGTGTIHKSDLTTDFAVFVQAQGSGAGGATARINHVTIEIGWDVAVAAAAAPVMDGGIAPIFQTFGITADDGWVPLSQVPFITTVQFHALQADTVRLRWEEDTGVGILLPTTVFMLEGVDLSTVYISTDIAAPSVVGLRVIGSGG